MAERIRCPKCGEIAHHAVEYRPPRQVQHGEPPLPECLRLICQYCGYASTRPCTDAGPTPEHAEICDVLGVEHSAPAPDWLPYAVRMTKVEIAVNGRRTKVYGGAMCCGGCGFGVDIRPGPGTQHPEPEALTRCPKCGYAGPRPTPETPQ